MAKRKAEQEQKQPKNQVANQEEPIESTALATVGSPAVTELWAIGAEKGYDHLLRVADIFAHSNLVPERYRCTCGKRGDACTCGKVGDCSIVTAMALKHRADILGFMQKVYVVYGTPGMESQLAIALVNQAGVFEGPIDYEFEGQEGSQERKCTAWAIERRTGRRVERSVSIADANRAGWTKPVKLKGGGTMPSKWVEMPEDMLIYRSAMKLIRTYHPEILFGMYTVDELEEIGPKTIDAEVVHPNREENLRRIGGTPTAKLPGPGTQEVPLRDSIAASAVPVDGAQQGARTPAVKKTIASTGEGALMGPEIPPSDDPSQSSLFESSGKMPSDAALDAAFPENPFAEELEILLQPSPTTTEGMKAERLRVAEIYTTLAQKADVPLLSISSTATKILKAEGLKLIEQLS